MSLFPYAVGMHSVLCFRNRKTYTLHKCALLFHSFLCGHIYEVCIESILSHAETLLNMLVHSPRSPFIATQPLLVMLKIGVSLKSRVHKFFVCKGCSFKLCLSHNTAAGFGATCFYHCN